MLDIIMNNIYYVYQLYVDNINLNSLLLCDYKLNQFSIQLI